MIFFDNLSVTLTQVGVLFIMIALGFALYKTKIIGTAGIEQMTGVLLWGVTPCLLVKVFSQSYSESMAVSLLWSLVFALVFMLCALGINLFLWKKQPLKDRGVLRFASVFSNCGFMGIPLAAAVYGHEGAAFASIFLIAFNLTQWTAGFAVMSGGRPKLKKLMLNPGVIGLFVSLPIFIFKIKLPNIIMSPVSAVADMNTPLAMIVIGGFLARTNIGNAMRDWRIYALAALRLVVFPLSALALLYVLPLPLSPVTTTILPRGICRFMFFKLWVFALVMVIYFILKLYNIKRISVLRWSFEKSDYFNRQLHYIGIRDSFFGLSRKRRFY